MIARKINTLLNHYEAAVILLPLALIIFIPGLMEHLGFLGLEDIDVD